MRSQDGDIGFSYSDLPSATSPKLNATVPLKHSLRTLDRLYLRAFAPSRISARLVSPVLP